MIRAFHPATRAVAVAVLLSGLAIAMPAWAQTTPAAAPAPAAPTAKAAKHADRIEQHVAQLKKQLEITDAQSSQWDAFAQVMRDNGHAMEAALQQREDAKGGGSAVDDMKAYEAIAQAHADGMAKLVPAFQILYDGLSPEQKKNADVLFENTRHGKMAAKAKKAK